MSGLINLNIGESESRNETVISHNNSSEGGCVTKMLLSIKSLEEAFLLDPS